MHEGANSLALEESYCNSGSIYSRSVWRSAEGRGTSAVRVTWMKKSFSSIQAVFCALQLQLRTKYIPCSYGAFDLMDLMNVRRCGQKAKRISDGDNILNENKRV